MKSCHARSFPAAQARASASSSSRSPAQKSDCCSAETWAELVAELEEDTCAEFHRGWPRTAPRSRHKPQPRCARTAPQRLLLRGRIGRTLAWHSGISQMMLATFSTQGRINRAFFDQRAKKDTPGRPAVQSPGTLYLGVPGQRRKQKIARTREHQCFHWCLYCWEAQLCG